MSAGRAAVLCWRPSHAEAARVTALYRTKFDRPDAPPYRVRKRRSGHHDVWRIYTPEGRIADRRRA